MTAAAPAPSGERLAALDGLRGLAILIVLIYHYTVRWTVPEDTANHFPAASIFSGMPVVGQFGWAGVSLFFMISGFVIHMTLERSRSILDFGIRRFARLWPPMLLAATLTTVAMHVFGPADWRPTVFEYVLSVLFIPPALIGEAIGREGIYTWVDGAYWTLFVEVRFYVLAAVVWLIWPRRFLEVLVIFAAVGLAAYTYAAQVSPVVGQIIDLFTFAKEASFFAFGALAYAYYTGARGWATVGGLIVCALLTFAIAGTSPTRIGLNFIALALMVGVFVSRGRGMSIFAHGVMPFVGRISYSLYLLHQMIGVSLLVILTTAGLPIGLAIATVTGLMILLAWASFRLVEVPARDWLTSNLKEPSALLVKWAPGLAFRPSRPR